MSAIKYITKCATGIEYIQRIRDTIRIHFDKMNYFLIEF